MKRSTVLASIARASSLVALIAAATTLPSCGDDGSELYLGVLADPDEPEEAVTARVSTEPAPALTDAHVVLVTIDGVRWQDVLTTSLMPRTRALVDAHGVGLGGGGDGCGVVQTASAANISLPGYLEIFTGAATACTSNECDRTSMTTVFDEANRAGAAPVASISSWPQIHNAVSRGDSGVLVAAGRMKWTADRPPVGSRLAALLDAGDAAEAFPSTGHYRPDRYTASIALEYFREHAPALFHVGLVDADEWAHRSELEAYARALHDSDALIGDLADAIARSDAADRTTVIVTTDHGRNSNFKDHSALRYDSSRTFVLAFGARVPARGVVCAPRDYKLTDVAPTIRAILGLPQVRGSHRGKPIAEIVR